MATYKKIISFFLLSFFFSPFLFSQEEKTEFKLKNWDFFFTLGPVIYVNTDSDSAPSPIMFSGGIGFDFFNDKPVSFQPKLSFFSNYYLWDGENARPAEIENRTAQVLSFLLDLDASHTWFFKSSALQAGGGLGILGRFGFLANGVDSTYSNDVSSINSWFWKKLNFIYPNINISWMRRLESQWHAGFETRLYIPAGALIDGRGLDTMMVSFGVRVLSK